MVLGLGLRLTYAMVLGLGLRLTCAMVLSTQKYVPIRQLSPGCVCHAFEVTVDGVRGLSVFSNTVWGEADCFVQYHFPAISEEATEDNEGEGMTRYTY